jgi:hypothetical protein
MARQRAPSCAVTRELGPRLPASKLHAGVAEDALPRLMVLSLSTDARPGTRCTPRGRLVRPIAKRSLRTGFCGQR